MTRSSPKHRGTCIRCGQVRTLVSLLRGYCKPCGYEKGNCTHCLAYRKLYVSGRCYLCYQDDLIRRRLSTIQLRNPACEYNQYLFDLYLSYLKRHRMSYDHLKPTLGLIRYLEQTPLTPIHSWSDIYKLSKSKPLTRSPGKDVHDNGCAWMKIGYMLLELGVLGSRSDEYKHRIDVLLEDFNSETAERISTFARLLKKSGRTEGSIFNSISELRSLNHWLSELDPPETLLLAGVSSLECYFDIICGMRSYSSVVVVLRRIRAFYHFAQQSYWILQDPTQNICPSRASQKLVICSKTQFEQLNVFLRNPNSNPEQALLIILILFYGFTTADLSGSSLDRAPKTQGQIKIILPRRPRSRGRRYYNREQILELPLDPPWLKNLTERFCERWRAHFAKIKPRTTFPRSPLFLDSKFLHNRNVSCDHIRSLIKKATAYATGTEISPRVLRQTCGHVMTRGDDASVLGHLGWSPQFAFHYTWLPRVLFQPKI